MPEHHFDPNLVVSTILHGPAKVLKQSFLSGLRNGDEGGTHAGNLTSGVAAAGATSFACNLLAIYLSTFLAWPACESDAATTTTATATTTMRLGGTKSRVAAERAYFRLIESASRYVTQNWAVWCIFSLRQIGVRFNLIHDVRALLNGKSASVLSLRVQV